ncbi:hypothetical protein LDG_7558 [Legionella drancourtii LLAP12]|uniref:Uncharacterized protein n=1 Tax=Legionella drancourtii LLAP12 TaxID=658187 RepID=G9EQL0_9GAMM|nr:hypothetical protein LDG_7558 [Legionella drancourtii LLAP12]
MLNSTRALVFFKLGNKDFACPLNCAVKISPSLEPFILTIVPSFYLVSSIELSKIITKNSLFGY